MVWVWFQSNQLGLSFFKKKKKRRRRRSRLRNTVPSSWCLLTATVVMVMICCSHQETSAQYTVYWTSSEVWFMQRTVREWTTAFFQDVSFIAYRTKGNLWRNIYVLITFLIGHKWVDCNMTFKMGPSSSLSRKACTSLRRIWLFFFFFNGAGLFLWEGLRATVATV